jgi:hypothetical protein
MICSSQTKIIIATHNQAQLVKSSINGLSAHRGYLGMAISGVINVRVHYNNRTCADDANAVVENNKTWFCKAGCNRIHVDDEDPCPEWAC